MRPLIAANWKMNPPSLAAAAALARAICAAPRRPPTIPKPAATACSAPATALTTLAAILSGTEVRLGAQDCHAESSGPRTGDISAAMLADAGATHVILGHSERRADHGETNATVRGKTRAAQAAGLIPIVCVGETAGQRAAGRQTEIVGDQLQASLPPDFAGILAYEPVWAIGTGRTPTPAEVAAMHRFIVEALARQFAATPRWTILYGGSVNPANAATLLRLPHVGGALVGGASLDPAAYAAIVQAACA